MGTTPTIPDIIRRAGGPGFIETASNGKVRAEAVYKWAKIGIPDRHWPLIMGLSGATADELLAANVKARAPIVALPDQQVAPS